MSSHTLEGKKKTQNGVKRLMFTVLSILLEVVFLVGIFKGLNEYAVFIDNLTRIFAVILVLKIYGRNETSSMKTPWIILILTFPILGVALYFMIGMNGGTRKMRMRYKRIDEKLLPLLPENKEVLERLNVSDPKAGNVSNYIERNACYPVYQNTDVTYFDEAVKGLEAQLTDLAKAEQFIFMEYHAIEDEYAWSRIQTVLEERVKEGVEVRVFYDDMGSIGTQAVIIWQMSILTIHIHTGNGRIRESGWKEMRWLRLRQHFWKCGKHPGRLRPMWMFWI